MQNRVAIIGYSFRFPGTTKQNFWRDLVAQKNFITQVDATRWPQENFLHPDSSHPGSSYTFAAGSLGDVSGFDAAFFGVSPREAALMDPQQRILLELAWESFENAGIVPSAMRGSDCGVFVGISNVDYAYRMADDLYAIASSTATGIISSIAANRISYLFDLHGPSIALDTACSSSLVAFHQACQAIKSGEISSALAGGINLHLHPYGFISFSKAKMLSKTGQCHVFDASADGYVRSEGGGLVLLKNYHQAVTDGDPILAIVAGSAVNTDGHKTSLTIPNPIAQANLLSAVYDRAGIGAKDIDYFEAHGTGTAVGDPIETQAIGLALGQNRQSRLLIGSVKSNLGHLESASGIAGLIKAIHCLEHRMVPATIGIKNPNPHIKFTEWNLQVATKNQPLPAQGQLTIGINSFGFGGSNAHVILQSLSYRLPLKQSVTNFNPSGIEVPLLMSAKDQQALRHMALATKNLMSKAQQDDCFYDIAYSAFFHRERHAQRAVLFAKNAQEAVLKLTDYLQSKISPTQTGVYTGLSIADSQGPAFIFAGNGCQWQGMGQALLEQSAVFRDTLVEIDRYFCQYADYSLIDELSGKLGNNRYQNTEFAQPALFALQVGITAILRDKGIHPIAVVGHSVGEVAAAWAAGALSLPDAVQVIYYRSYFQSQTKGLGEMMAVGLDTIAVQELLAHLALKQVVIACMNSSRSVTVAGDYRELEILESELKTCRIFYKRLNLHYPFHTPVMDVIEPGIKASLVPIRPRAGNTGFFSTVSGTLLSGDQLNADYWWGNIRQPVKFQNSIDALLNADIKTFIEIGAHPILKTYLLDGLKVNSVHGTVIPSLKRNDGNIDALYQCYAETLLSGCLDSKQPSQKTNPWFPVRGKLAKLPNYAWQREKFWHPVTTESDDVLTRKKCHPFLGYPIKRHERQWENQLDTQLHPFLSDHNIGGSILFPGAGFVEIALAAAHQLSPGPFLAIEELEIRAPLLLSHESTKLIRCSVTSDGRLSLASRELADSTEWSPHLVGRVLSDPSGARLVSTATLAIPTRIPDFDRNSHYLLTGLAGLNYGQAFQTLKHGWRDGESAVGVFEQPEPTSSGQGDFFLHPAFLDGAFQLVFQILSKELSRYEEEISFVPIKLGNILVRGSKATPCYAKATILNRSTHSLNTEFLLFDSDATCLALFQGVRFRAVKLHSTTKPKHLYLEYYLTAAPLTSHQSDLAIDPKLLAAYSSDIAENSNTDRYCQEVEPLLDSLCHQFITETLAHLADASGFLSEQCITGYHENHQGLDCLLKFWLTFAEQNLTLSVTQGGWQTTIKDESQELSAQAIWYTLIAEYPDYFYLAHLVGRVGLYFPKIIRGIRLAETPAMDADCYANIVRSIFIQTHKQAVNKLLLEQCRQWIAAMPVGGRLKILETSSGHPEFATFLCSQLDLTQCDYYYAGLSEQAINAAESLRGTFPLLKTMHMGKATDNIANFAIVFLNFGTVEALQQLLGQLPLCLAPGSTVLFIGLQPANWIDYVLSVDAIGLHDPELATCKPTQLSAAQWLGQLKANHFKNCQTHANLADGGAGVFILSCRSPDNSQTMPAPSATGNWLIMAGADGAEQLLAKQLGKQLSAQGQWVTYSEHRWRLPETLENFQHIVHLSGYGQADMAVQTQRCELAGEIFKTTGRASNRSNLWLFTQNVSSLYSCDQPQAFSDRPMQIAYDAVLCGFGRSLMNEVSHSHVRLLDMTGTAATISADTLTAICHELLIDNKEQEVFFDGQGKRFATRLRSRNHLVGQTLEQSCNTKFKIALGFKLPGPLKNLYWQATSKEKALADNGIEVSVKATGLNFRDIMYSLGMLSDEAVENGFVGASLGLEFAGVITRVGGKANGYRPGDAVVGMGPASFSNIVNTTTNAIAPIPKNLGFAAAATLPSAFFTAFYSLHQLARLQPGERVLIHGAAGGVGIAAIQVARWLGADIFATVGSAEKRDFLKLLGIEHIYDSRSLSFAEEILAQTDNQGVDVILNSLSGEAINRNFQVLKPFGRFLELGKRDFYENTAIGLRPFRNNISYFGIDVDQLMLGQPMLARQLFTDMMALFNNGVLHPLPYTVFDAHQIVDAFRHMQQSKQIGKVVVTYDNGIYAKSNRIPAKKALQLCPEASFLVTGGLGGFGLRTAQWLAEKGARHLILVSRNGASSDEAKLALKQFALQGVNVLASSCDVIDKAALVDLLAKCQDAMPPLKGIVHAAAVIEDGLASQTDFAQIRRVLAPKIMGAQHLHELTLHLPLEFFVLYSSVATLFGNPGQGAYVAANTWLEALAAFRRQQGLTATCISWGAIDDVGFLARHEKTKEALQNRMGGAALNSALALDELEQMLLQNLPTLGISQFDWRILSKFIISSPSPKFSELASAYPRSNAEDLATDIKNLLGELSDEELQACLVDMLKEEVGRVLLIAKEKIDNNQLLYDMGMDSLMGVELVLAIESRFEVQIPVMALGEASTVNKLAGLLLAKLRGDGSVSTLDPISNINELARLHSSQISDERIIAVAQAIDAANPIKIIGN